MLAGGYRPGRGMVTVKNNDWKIMIEKQRPEIPIENTDRNIYIAKYWLIIKIWKFCGNISSSKSFWHVAARSSHVEGSIHCASV
jgi:hypothetical protein